MNMPNNIPAIEVHDVTVSYNKKAVLWDIDLILPQGQLIGIVGPNGAGKSTLLKAMMGIVSLDSGYVKFLDKPLQQVRKQVSYVPQRKSVDWQFPALVYDVVMMGRYAHMGFWKHPKALDKEIVADSMQQVGIASLAQRQIGALSGGQQQRVFLARALAQKANIYALDEPFTGVDTSTEKLTLQVLQQLTLQGKTVVMVHHSLEAVERYCGYTVLMNMYVRAAGPTKETLTSKHIQDTYGSNLTILSDVQNLLYAKEVSPREKIK